MTVRVARFRSAVRGYLLVLLFRPKFTACLFIASGNVGDAFPRLSCSHIASG